MRVTRLEQQPGWRALPSERQVPESSGRSGLPQGTECLPLSNLIPLKTATKASMTTAGVPNITANAPPMFAPIP